MAKYTEPDWTAHVSDKEFTRHPIVVKEGTIVVKFVDNGNLVSKETTNLATDSVVFVCEGKDGQEQELWLSIDHPLLRQLKKAMPLEGKTATLKFEGKGMNKIGTLEKME